MHGWRTLSGKPQDNAGKLCAMNMRSGSAIRSTAVVLKCSNPCRNPLLVPMNSKFRLCFQCRFPLASERSYHCFSLEVIISTGCDFAASSLCAAPSVLGQLTAQSPDRRRLTPLSLGQVYRPACLLSVQRGVGLQKSS